MSVAVQTLPRIGLDLERVLDDWGLVAGAGGGHLRDAVALLLTHGGLHPSRAHLLVCGAAIRDALRAGPLWPKKGEGEGKIEAKGAATVFQLTLRQTAVLIELRWAALAETKAEMSGHLEHALTRLEEEIEASRSRG